MLGREVQEQHERIPVCRHGTWTQRSLLSYVLCKEGLYERGE